MSVATTEAQLVPKQKKTFHFETIRPTIEGLMFNMERDLKRRSESSSTAMGHGYVLLRIAALYTKYAYDAIRFLCADEYAKGRRPEYIFVVPSIIRTMIEALFTIMYLAEDFPNRVEAYNKAGWREHYEERHKYKTEYSANPEWKTFFKNFDTSLEMGSKLLEISEAEAKDPKSIEYFPAGASLIESMGQQNRSFAKWLDKWFYREVSAVAHFTPLGVLKIGGYLLKDQHREQDAKFIDEVSLPSFRGFQLSMATIVVTAVASEFEHSFRLKNRGQIVEIWGKLRAAFPDADAICRKRYDELLGM